MSRLAELEKDVGLICQISSDDFLTNVETRNAIYDIIKHETIYTKKYYIRLGSKNRKLAIRLEKPYAPRPGYEIITMAIITSIPQDIKKLTELIRLWFIGL